MAKSIWSILWVCLDFLLIVAQIFHATVTQNKQKLWNTKCDRNLFANTKYFPTIHKIKLVSCPSSSTVKEFERIMLISTELWWIKKSLCLSFFDFFSQTLRFRQIFRFFLEYIISRRKWKSVPFCSHQQILKIYYSFGKSYF